MSISVDLAFGEETDERIQKLAVSMFPDAFLRFIINVGRVDRVRSDDVVVTAFHPESGHKVSQRGSPGRYAAVKHPEPTAEAAIRTLGMAIAQLEAMIRVPVAEQKKAVPGRRSSR